VAVASVVALAVVVAVTAVALAAVVAVAVVTAVALAAVVAVVAAAVVTAVVAAATKQSNCNTLTENERALVALFSCLRNTTLKIVKPVTAQSCAQGG
jgi:hypothetical protein